MSKRYDTAFADLEHGHIRNELARSFVLSMSRAASYAENLCCLGNRDRHEVRVGEQLGRLSSGLGKCAGFRHGLQSIVPVRYCMFRYGYDSGTGAA